MSLESFREEIRQGIPAAIPEMPPSSPNVNHAPPRPDVLDLAGKRLALANALRYFPKAWQDLHATLQTDLLHGGQADK